jgi:hypothetical protein
MLMMRLILAFTILIPGGRVSRVPDTFLETIRLLLPFTARLPPLLGCLVISQPG